MGKEVEGQFGVLDMYREIIYVVPHKQREFQGIRWLKGLGFLGLTLLMLLWIEILQQLPAELEVKLRITLSYYIEPNPGRRGYRQRYSYQSHGLRFEIIRPGQSMENFRNSVNGLDVSDDYDGPDSDEGY